LKKIETHNVPDINKEVRLSDYVVGIFETITSKKGMKKAIINGQVKLNGETGRTADYIRGGETIDLYKPKLKKSPSIKIDLQVVYEDDFLAIVHKPAGIVVSGNKKYSLENALQYNLYESLQKDALERPEPIHRLDFPTSGALLIGKTRQAVTALNKLFEERKIEKTYYAITIGSMNKKGIIKSDIKGKKAETSYTVSQTIDSNRFLFLNLVELKPITGRRHQLRVHMLEIGNPILGDQMYGKEELILKGKGLFLHASSLSFVHPISNEVVNATIPLPQKFVKLFPSSSEEE